MVASYYKGGGHYIVACTPTRDRGQDLDPSNFRAWPLDRTENLALTLDYPALTTPIDRLEKSPLWFSVQLPNPTMDDIEVRICGDESADNEDTPIGLLEIYISWFD